MGVTVRWAFAAGLAVRRGFEEPRCTHCQEKQETELFLGTDAVFVLRIRYYFDSYTQVREMTIIASFQIFS